MQAPVVFITGCSTGIGRAIAVHLAARGYQVVATARRLESLEGLQAALHLQLDVTDPESVTAAVQKTVQQLGRIDVLINNAGYGQIGAVEDIDDDLLQKNFDVNVYGPMRLIRAVVPRMRTQGSGRIINISSVSGRFSTPLMGVYCATKYALEALSDALRNELALFGIQVVLIEPGMIRSAFVENARPYVQAVSGPSHTGYGSLYPKLEQLMGRLMNRAPGPESVVRAVEKAIRAGRPGARYSAPTSAWFTAKLLPLVSYRLIDWAMQRALRRMLFKQ